MVKPMWREVSTLMVMWLMKICSEFCFSHSIQQVQHETSGVSKEKTENWEGKTKESVTGKIHVVIRQIQEVQSTTYAPKKQATSVQDQTYIAW